MCMHNHPLDGGGRPRSLVPSFPRVSVTVKHFLHTFISTLICECFSPDVSVGKIVDHNVRYWYSSYCYLCLRSNSWYNSLKKTQRFLFLPSHKLSHRCKNAPDNDGEASCRMFQGLLSGRETKRRVLCSWPFDQLSSWCPARAAMEFNLKKQREVLSPDLRALITRFAFKRWVICLRRNEHRKTEKKYLPLRFKCNMFVLFAAIITTSLSC